MIYNNITKEWCDNALYRGIVYIDNKYIEFGFFNVDTYSVPIVVNDCLFYLQRSENCKVPLYWMNSSGCYTLNCANSDNIITHSKRVWNYPINRVYNFSKLNLVPKNIVVDSEKEFNYIKSFTFGLEYETSAGNVPWIDCINYNLVPLYDGSISGHEYVTFPLTYSELPLIRRHLDLLKEWTEYNYNCSLHIHFGQFPIDENTILKLCKNWYYFQWQISKYIPEYSFYVEKYKDNGKAYNKPFPKILSLATFYNKYTGNIFESNKSLYLPNLYDSTEEHKWQVNGRYFNMNIIHLISGKSHKTVEFRFLMPTTDYSELKWYLLILGAFLTYVIKSDDTAYSKITIEKVIDFVFPKSIAEKLKIEGIKLCHLRKFQINYHDYSGTNLWLKSLYLKEICKFDM